MNVMLVCFLVLLGIQPVHDGSEEAAIAYYDCMMDLAFQADSTGSELRSPYDIMEDALIACVPRRGAFYESVRQDFAEAGFPMNIQEEYAERMVREMEGLMYRSLVGGLEYGRGTRAEDSGSE